MKIVTYALLAGACLSLVACDDFEQEAGLQLHAARDGIRLMVARCMRQQGRALAVDPMAVPFIGDTLKPDWNNVEPAARPAGPVRDLLDAARTGCRTQIRYLDI